MGLPDTDMFYDNLKVAMLERVKTRQRVEAVESLGLLLDDLVLKLDTPLDTLSHFLAKKLQLGKILL
jgi:alpha-aminoadipic semialdehyde synthase